MPKKAHVRRAAERMRDQNCAANVEKLNDAAQLRRDAEYLRDLCVKKKGQKEWLDGHKGEVGDRIMKILRRQVFHAPTTLHRQVLLANPFTTPLAFFNPFLKPGNVTKAKDVSLHFCSATGPHYGYTSYEERRSDFPRFDVHVNKRVVADARERVGTTIHELHHTQAPRLAGRNWCDCVFIRYEIPMVIPAPYQLGDWVPSCNCRRPDNAHDPRSWRHCAEAPDKCTCSKPTSAQLRELVDALNGDPRGHGPYYLGWVKIAHERFDPFFGKKGLPDITGSDYALGLYRQGYGAPPGSSSVADPDYRPPEPSRKRSRRDAEDDDDQPGPSSKWFGTGRRR